MKRRECLERAALPPAQPRAGERPGTARGSIVAVDGAAAREVDFGREWNGRA